MLRPSHQHSVFSATVLLMGSVMASRALGYLREMYIAWAFGAGHQTDAYFAAFQIPDFLNYILAGGTASITFISIYTRHVSRDDEAGAQHAFNVTITIMSAVLCVGTVFLEIFTPQLVRLVFPKFSADQIELCVHLTRILLPGQIFFYAGGIVSAVLLAKRMFLYPALSPALYNVFIILGGVVGAKSLGISSLAWGALAGAFLGPFLINAIGAAQGGLRYCLQLRLAQSRISRVGEAVHPADAGRLAGLRRRLDPALLRLGRRGRHLATELCQAPVRGADLDSGPSDRAGFDAVLRLAVGARQTQALRRYREPARSIASRRSSFLASAWMMAAALPIIDLAFRHGHFTFADAQETATYFFWFALSLALWSAQAQYARAFYGAGDTLTPMVASTIIVVLSLPVYRTFFHQFGVTGLAIASDVGILMHTVVLAWLLHRRKMVSLSELPWGELTKGTGDRGLRRTCGVRRQPADHRYVAALKRMRSR